MRLSWLSGKTNGKDSHILQTGVLFQSVALDELFLFVSYSGASGFITCSSGFFSLWNGMFQLYDGHSGKPFFRLLYREKTSHSALFLFRYFCRGTVVWMRIKNEWLLESILWHVRLKAVSQRLKQLCYDFSVYSQVIEVTAYFLCVCLIFAKYLNGQKADWSEMFSFSSLFHNVTTYTTLRSRICSVKRLWQDAELFYKHPSWLCQESELLSTLENEALL